MTKTYKLNTETGKRGRQKDKTDNYGNRKGYIVQDKDETGTDWTGKRGTNIIKQGPRNRNNEV